MENLVALVIASAVLVAIPGPNVALTVANSLRFGFLAGVLTGAGASIGIGLQLALVVFGLSALIEVAASALMWLKWAGVVYLVVLGIITWRTPVNDLDATQARSKFIGHATLIAVTNPKTLMFNAAFLPQFISVDAGTPDMLLAAAVMLSVVFAGDVLWALFASKARAWIASFAAYRNRVTALFLVAAGAGLALSRR